MHFRASSLLAPLSSLVLVSCTTVTVIERVEPTPTLAIVNARVWTGDAKRPWADAVLVTGDRITTVGSSAEVRKAVRPPTRVIDANGAMLAPGFLESDSAPGADFLEKQKGTIARGMLADLVLIDRDLTRVQPDQLRDARVMLTIVGGRVVYEREAAVRP